MIFGMTPILFIHVLISLIAIAIGLIALFDLLAGRMGESRTAIFLATTVATSVSGFLIPPPTAPPSPPQIVGAISLVLLAIALFALYVRKLQGSWGPIYVVTAMLSLYLNVFVLVVQAFLKVPALNALAPKGSEPPFAIAQVIVLALFVLAIYAAVRRIRRTALEIS